MEARVRLIERHSGVPFCINQSIIEVPTSKKILMRKSLLSNTSASHGTVVIMNSTSTTLGSERVNKKL